MSSGERTRIAKRAFNDVDSAVNKVWPTVVRLGQLPGVVDLGQGWPNLAEDSAIVARRAAAQAITESTDRKVNQYSPIPGRPELQQSISKYYERAYGIELASATEIAITTSGTEALYATIMALVDPGDEVIMFEPFFPWYAAHVKLAGGVCKAITLQPPQFGIDDSAILAIKAAITPKTKLLMFNSPHNPSGHVASKEELQQLSEICVQNSLLVLSDEVYEGCTFPSAKVKHYRLSEFEGMKERTVTVGSASKLFSLVVLHSASTICSGMLWYCREQRKLNSTCNGLQVDAIDTALLLQNRVVILCLGCNSQCGWRVGWITGPEDLVGAAKSIHGYTT